MNKESGLSPFVKEAVREVVREIVFGALGLDEAKPAAKKKAGKNRLSPAGRAAIAKAAKARWAKIRAAKRNK